VNVSNHFIGTLHAPTYAREQGFAEVRKISEDGITGLLPLTLTVANSPQLVGRLCIIDDISTRANISPCTDGFMEGIAPEALREMISF
jgi:hypothetical protein